MVPTLRRNLAALLRLHHPQNDACGHLLHPLRLQQARVHAAWATLVMRVLLRLASGSVAPSRRQWGAGGDLGPAEADTAGGRGMVLCLTGQPGATLVKVLTVTTARQ